MLLIFICVACSEENSVNFTERSISEHECENCPNIEIRIPEAIGNKKIAKTINEAIREEVIELLNFEEEGAIETLDDAVSNFQKEYRDITEEFPDAIVGWEARIQGKVDYYHPNLLSIVVDAYLFTGGAHGYSTTRYLNFDTQAGTQLELTDMVENEAELTRLAENIFRKKEAIDENASINSTGFMFENETFYLPENIGLSEEGMRLHYNAYEIASYADGPIEIILPMEEVRTLLKQSYQR